MVTLTKDKLNFSLYFDGEMVAKNSFPNWSYRPSNLFRINMHHWSGGSRSSTRLSGSYDSVRIYNRALSLAEIQALKNMRRTLRPIAEAVVKNGFLVAVNLDTEGRGYLEPPKVSIVGGGGFGGAASAVFDNGKSPV